MIRLILQTSTSLVLVRIVNVFELQVASIFLLVLRRLALAHGLLALPDLLCYLRIIRVPDAGLTAQSDTA